MWKVLSSTPRSSPRLRIPMAKPDSRRRSTTEASMLRIRTPLSASEAQSDYVCRTTCGTV